AGRGQSVSQSAVKEYAVKKNLRLLQPTNLKDEGFISELKSLNANLQVVVAFRMLPEVVWKMPEFGTFNLHASLLPQYRGAAPINWAIMNGEKTTGVTTFFIDDKIDTGATILSREIPIDADENAGSLHDRLMELGSEAVVDTLKLISDGKAEPVAQPSIADLKTAHKLNRDNCHIDFSKTAAEVHNQIRGLSPYPGAWCTFHDGGQEWQVKIFESAPDNESHSSTSGRIRVVNRQLKIAAEDKYVNVKVLQFPGKKKMTAAELLNGLTFSSEARVS
ncbi:MAG: methionyl-tRNA formyltransferase, partial [Flavobacterium sp.]